MIKSITVTNPNDESLKIDLFRPEETGLAVYSIDGLGPATASINMTDLSGMDGSVYNSARIQNRNVVIQFKFLWKPTVESVRLLTYKYFPIKKQIKLDVETEHRKCYVIGYVESNEPDIFSSDEGCQISILCSDPYFYESGDGQDFVISGVENLFEFPFSNEIITGEEKNIEFGAYKERSMDAINYLGDMDSGMEFIVSVDGIYIDHPLVMGNIVLYKNETGEKFTINIDRLNNLLTMYYPTSPETEHTLINGDELYISTLRGSKHVYHMRRGNIINAMNSVDMNSQWIQLTPGTNEIGYYVENDSHPNVKLKVRYKNAYGGI